MTLQQIPCVILCGGKSSRMGSDKCFLPIGSKTLVQFQYDKFSHIFEKVYISAKNDKFKQQFPRLIVDNPQFSTIYSPMLALYSILSHFTDTYVFIIGVDLPNIDEKELQEMFDLINNEKIIVAQSKFQRHYLCGFYHSSLSSLCLSYLKQNYHKISTLFENSFSKSVVFDDEEKFINLNFYEDYLKLKNEK